MENITQMLELMDRPAFCVEDGRITAANAAALARQFELNAPVEELLTSGKEEYRAFQDGCLYLTLTAGGERYGADITRVGSAHIFALDPEDLTGETRLLALVAQELRDPLSGAMALVDEHLEPDRLWTAQLSRELHRMLRMVGNLSGHPVTQMEMQDINALVREVWDSLVPHCEKQGRTLTFTEHPVPIYSCVDGSLLTRAIHNLVSNALKYTAEGGVIGLALTVRMHTVYLTVQDSGSAGNQTVADPFTRFRREPGIGDGRNGLGLGLKLVRDAATVHGGTALVRQDGGFRVTLTLPIRQDTANLRSPIHRVDYAGDRNVLLIELADVLPPESYLKP